LKRVISIKNLEYAYPDGTKALKGVNLDVFEGESVGLIGPNGAGKTTLLLHLNGILRGRGTIEILGKEVKEKNLREIRSSVGVVFQDPDDQLFLPTVFDDISFGPINLNLSEREVKDRVRKALEQVNLSGYEKRSSHHLSFGEKKRVSIATVLSMEPRILVLDEPTSNLDPAIRRELMRLLKGFKITKIIATNDMELVWEVCDRVIVLFDGKIVADSDTKKILTDVKLLESYGLEPPPLVRFLKRIGWGDRPPSKFEDEIKKFRKRS
jgi:cobalt/nickel transport system ATP-binding protein